MANFIKVSNVDRCVIYQLNDSEAAKGLLKQLPIKTKVENYASNEKIVYLKANLPIQNTPLANHGISTLSYFEPWNNIVMYYDEFGPYPGLYEIGQLIQGQEEVIKLQGEITIEVYEDDENVDSNK